MLIFGFAASRKQADTSVEIKVPARALSIVPRPFTGPDTLKSRSTYQFLTFVTRALAHSSDQISTQLKDTKFAQEGLMLEKCAASEGILFDSCSPDFLLDRFFKMLEDNPLRAWYGEAHVFKAAERGAIGKLLISDEIFRCVQAIFDFVTTHVRAPLASVLTLNSVAVIVVLCSSPSVVRRKLFVKLVEDVKAYGGETLIFSSMHESGQRELMSPLRHIRALCSRRLSPSIANKLHDASLAHLLGRPLS